MVKSEGPWQSASRRCGRKLIAVLKGDEGAFVGGVIGIQNDLGDLSPRGDVDRDVVEAVAGGGAGIGVDAIHSAFEDELAKPVGAHQSRVEWVVAIISGMDWRRRQKCSGDGTQRSEKYS